MLLDAKRAVVTGASSGIGKATAQRLAREGAAVCVNYHTARERDAAQSVVDGIRRNGSRAIAVMADVGDEAAVQRMAEEVLAEFGGVDLLVNNAGINQEAALFDMALDNWEAVLRTNLTGAFLCMREIGGIILRGGGGVVVNISSVHEYIPWRKFSHYCASKGGLKLLMESAASELAGRRIRIVNIAPGAIETPMNQVLQDDPEARRAAERQIPIGRIGRADEVAAVVAWVASEEASYITGTTIVVDGGLSLHTEFA